MSKKPAIAIAEAIREALSGDMDVDAIGSLLHPAVIWTDCVGRDTVLGLLRSATHVSPELITVEALDDRVFVSLGLADTTWSQTLFISDGLISHIVDVADVEEARRVDPLRDVPAPSGERAVVGGVAPIFAVRDVSKAVAHYGALGFDVHHYGGDAAYGFAHRDSIDIHLAQVTGLSPAANTSATYLFVDDADALFAEWRLAGVQGRFVEPEDTDYGLREGAHVDPDGNLIRFGSGIA